MILKKIGTPLNPWVCFLLTMLIFVTPIGVQAQESSNIVEMTLVPNDISSADKSIIFDPVKGQVYEFSFELVNPSADEELMVSIFPSVALSNESAIQYTVQREDLLDINYDITQYIQLSLDSEEPLVLEPLERKTIQAFIEIPEDDTLVGELLGGINFAQVVGFQENEDSINLESVLQQVVVVRLGLGGEFESQAFHFQDFAFTTFDNQPHLSLMLYNYNPQVRNSGNLQYQLISPKEEIIASSHLSDDLVLTPVSRTHLRLPLEDGAEIISGTYQFIVGEGADEVIYEFEFTESELIDFVTQNEHHAEIDSHRGNGPFMIAIILLVVNGIGIFLVLRKLNAKKSK